MGLLDIFRSRDKPVNVISGSAYNFFLGYSVSGKRVDERTSMQMTAVYACVRILSEAVASLLLHLYKYNDGGGKEKAVDHPLYFIAHDEPNPEMTSFIFRKTIMSICFFGVMPRRLFANSDGKKCHRPCHCS
jgi:phage portal protein BeeE